MDNLGKGLEEDGEAFDPWASRDSVAESADVCHSPPRLSLCKPDVEVITEGEES